MEYNRLPGITAIRIVRCADLPRFTMLESLSGAPIVLAAPATAIQFCGTPLLKWEGSIVNGAHQEKSTLEFATADTLPEGDRLAFVVNTAEGAQYLIGTREPNYPVITYTDTSGTPDGSAAIRTYKITHLAPKSVLRCIL